VSRRASESGGAESPAAAEGPFDDSAPVPAVDAHVEELAARLRDTIRVPVSTYRVQLSPDFRFADLHALVPYLDALGVGACYLSPILRARPGSRHGYDVVDHQELNPELGTREEFEALARDLQARGMGLLLDFVPNHMAVDPGHNPRWRDVLENGPSAMSAEWFDIDWQPSKEGLRDRVLLPILGDQYGNALERGELELALRNGALVVRYGEHVLPTDPRSVPVAFGPEVEDLRSRVPSPEPSPDAGAAASMDADERDMRELLSVMTAFANLPAYTERDAGRREERRREIDVAQEWFGQLLARSTAVRTLVDRALERLSGHAGVPESFDALHQVLERQPYRLAYWRTAFDEINYRRFFDINDLGAVRMEDPGVFAAAHHLVLELVQKELVTGLRLDHPDGLCDPEEYFERLQATAWRQRAEAIAGPDRRDLVDALVAWRDARRREDFTHWSVRPLYIAAEKIVTAGEQFRRRWAIHGGTGYRFLNLVNGILVDPTGLQQLERMWSRLSGGHEPFAEIAYESRRLIAQSAMASEMNTLAHALERLADRDRRSRDFTLNSLRRVLREIVASFPVYRTYVTARGVSDADRAVITRALDDARRRSPMMEASIFEFIERILTGGFPDAPDEEALRFAMRFQQITGSIQAKGLEDTAFYRYVPLLAVNEVGSHPASPSVTLSEFHETNQARLIEWPATLLTLATHDTKRGADARARLAVLGERPSEWRRAVAKWMRINAGARATVGGGAAPGRPDEYLFYQALVALWPAGGDTTSVPSVAPPGLEERLVEYMVKAIREAKVRSSWLRPDQAYENAVAAFVRAVLTGRGSSRFLARFVPFVRVLSRLGAANSLAQLVLMAGVPGVPDIYQGSELWHLCLVDPDNRRPVDFAARQAMLADFERDLEIAASQAKEAADQSLALVRELASQWADGRVKLWVTATVLRHRRRDPSLFLAGDYVALASDPVDAPLVAFARRHQDRAVVVIAPRQASKLAKDRSWPTGAAWGDARLILPPDLAARSWRDLLSGRTIGDEQPKTGTGRIRLADVLDPLPVGWLVSL
jgi:(1->4)-alpha-D-glucan 1-alpha-D-glucosylmutase